MRGRAGGGRRGVVRDMKVAIQDGSWRLWSLETSRRAQGLPARGSAAQVTAVNLNSGLMATWCDSRGQRLLAAVGQCEGHRETPKEILPLPGSCPPLHQFLPPFVLYSPYLSDGDVETFLTAGLEIGGDRKQGAWCVVRAAFCDDGGDLTSWVPPGHVPSTGQKSDFHGCHFRTSQ